LIVFEQEVQESRRRNAAVFVFKRYFSDVICKKKPTIYTLNDLHF